MSDLERRQPIDLDELRTEAAAAIKAGWRIGHYVMQACEEIERLRRTPAPQGGSGWRPIESAPKDGSDILACWPLSEAVGIVHHAQEPRSHGFEWLTEDDAFVSTPTYWQPLPSPPCAGSGPS